MHLTLTLLDFDSNKLWMNTQSITEEFIQNMNNLLFLS
ncbi:MAG: hypothetical protein BWY63_03620 [Chloroflexi bacterium ADurb.Bin360]|nr:MAG: hypothetical protein BWY63_03620 [Chloroflexi bacterium ADurb.Bin360]